MLIEPASLRENKVAQWLFWVLAVVMLALIYRDLWLGVWSEVVAAGGQWLHQLAMVFESLVSSPDTDSLQSTVVISPPSPEPMTPPMTPELPQTVGDLIADLQQQDEESSTTQP